MPYSIWRPRPTYGGIWKEWENVGEKWDSVLVCGGGIGDVGKYRLVGEMWRSVWGECGGCGEVGESVLGCEEVWRSVGDPTHFSTPPLHFFPHSPDTSSYAPTLIQHLYLTSLTLT